VAEGFDILWLFKKVTRMPNDKKIYSKIVSDAKAPAGVQELIKVYERFKEANAITEEYLKLISPQTYQSNSDKSLLA